MKKEIPGPYDEKVLPIQNADQELNGLCLTVLHHLSRVLEVNSHYILGYKLVEILEAENIDLEAELRGAADALAKWRELTQDMTEEEYYTLNRVNEKVKKRAI